MDKRLKTAILGTGKLGTDLLIKVLRSKYLDCSAFVGRNADSKGIALANSMGINTSCEGFSFLQGKPHLYDIVFDVTNALSHREHWLALQNTGKKVIDLTPSSLGNMVVPFINLQDALIYDNISLVSCGGQASLPILSILSDFCSDIESVEVVSSIASKSAGPNTRINIDEYISNTESAVERFTGCKRVKSILILSPASPEIHMKTTVYVESKCRNLKGIKIKLDEMLNKMNMYIPGYRICIGPEYDRGVITVGAEVTGRGDFLPSYAGNLDIINCAAIQIAETIATKASTVYA